MISVFVDPGCELRYSQFVGCFRGFFFGSLFRHFEFLLASQGHNISNARSRLAYRVSTHQPRQHISHALGQHLCDEQDRHRSQWHSTLAEEAVSRWLLQQSGRVLRPLHLKLTQLIHTYRYSRLARRRSTASSTECSRACRGLKAAGMFIPRTRALAH